jgi:hypothetical protein
VAKKRVICPIFEGDMPPKKGPQKWPLYDGHSMKAVNSTYIFILSNKFVMNGPISMELDSIHPYCYDDRIIFWKNFKEFWASAHLCDAFKKYQNQQELA